MSDESRAKDAVVESVDAVTEALGGESDEVDFGTDEEAGRALGARVGRELGGVLGRSVGEVVASGLQEGKSPRAVVGDVRRFLVEALSALLRDADVDAALAEVRETVLAPSPEDGDGSADEAATDEERDVASPDELRDLREETLRELLEVMSYQELQSIAKKVGVKANLDTETMRERIVDAFAEDIEEDSDDESDG